MHFHADAVDDLGWEPRSSSSSPADCATGVYALELAAAAHEDVVPFAVRPPAGDRRRANAVLLPTFTYLAYSCERDAPGLARSRPGRGPLGRERGLRSLYDRHDDGCGVYEASILRPLTQLRPGYRCPQHGGPHGLAQDLILLGLLDRRGIAADLLTDHDLHAEGVDALAGYRTVITGAHPEYATARAARGARGARRAAAARSPTSAATGSTAASRSTRDRPHVLELRRTETQGLAWQALPRRAPPRRDRRLRRRLAPAGPPRARLPRRRACRRSARRRPASYERAGDRTTRRPRSSSPGLEPATPRSATRARCSAAPPGYEVDNHDPVLGSPPDSVVLASAAGGRRLCGLARRRPRRARGPPRSARADMVLRRVEGGGAVFSVGSIAWTGCLAGDDANPVARVTENVLRELDRERPFGAPMAEPRRQAPTR